MYSKTKHMDPEVTSPAMGKCNEMCPQPEMRMRERERLLHPLEMVESTRNHKVPKADPKRIVKKYTRSAAGMSMNDLNILRPYEVLIDTIHYLLHDVITNEMFSWTVRYDFIFDRLRAVRQDMIIQDISRVQSITILQPIVKFHAFAAYKLCEESQNNFDHTLNNKHLQECLKRLLVMYDECQMFMDRCVETKVNYEVVFEDSRGTIEALYILHNLGDVSAIERALKLPIKWQTKDVLTSLKISINYCHGNWIKVCRLMNSLPLLLAATASLHLPSVRRKCFQVMSIAFSSKNLRFPLLKLKSCLLYSKMDDLLKDLKCYGLNEIENGEIRFDKMTFNSNIKQIRPRHEDFVDIQIESKNLSDLILFEKFG